MNVAELVGRAIAALDAQDNAEFPCKLDVVQNGLVPAPDHIIRTQAPA